MENLKAATTLGKIEELMNQIETVIIGKRPIIQLAVVAFLADGHVLFEDVPGVGKTMFVKTLARTVHARFNRIQFTPDLLPSDILGISIFEPKQQFFEFKKGPIFTDILLADEINRGTPRTQAALLEAMSERQVTIDGTTYPLSDNFFVLATQNPTDYEGTYPLPEAQLDRFLLNLKIGYPTFKEELVLLASDNRYQKLEEVASVLTKEDITELKQMVDTVFIHPDLLAYALQLVHATRTHDKIKLGISPRGSLAFVQAAKALAVTENRTYCLPDDFIRLIEPVFSHRLILNQTYRQNPEEIKKILTEIRRKIPIPVRSNS